MEFNILQSFESNMIPFYILGTLIVLFTMISKHSDLLSIKVSNIKKFFIFMVLVFIVKTLEVVYLFSPEDLMSMQVLLLYIDPVSLSMVYWEDAVHTLPIAIISRYVSGPKSKFILIPILILTMISFGYGHLYQGALAASLLSLYVPISYYYGLRFGFGTVMICHVMYDLTIYAYIIAGLLLW